MRAKGTAIAVSVLGLATCIIGSAASSAVEGFVRPTRHPKSRIHFATFGNAKFRESLARITKEAAAFGTFDTIFSISEAGLGTAFWERYGAFVDDNPRGFGYWIWKPWICLHILNALPEGDVLVYADAGCTLDPRRGGRLHHYIAKARAHADGIVAFRLNGLPEHHWTKASALDAFGCTASACRDEDQVMATAFLIRNSPATRRLVRTWLHMCTVDHGAFVVDSTADDECTTFKEHRHDQSIWSLLVKSHPGTVLYNDEIDNKGGPIWATRRRV